MLTPKISVIIPIYNMERYLGKALSSLKNQTLKEAEFICINDGSVDKSIEILNNYMKRDARFVIINQQNQGAGSARNNGLKAAKGEYIAFLDPDDFLEKKALETLYTKAKNEDLDVLTFDYKKVNEKGSILGNERIKDRLKLPENFTWKNLPYVFGSLVHMVWNKIYKRDFIENNHIHFTPCSLAEDCAFTLGAIINAKRIGYMPETFYNYLQRENSATHKVTDKNLCAFDVLDDIKNVLKDGGVEQELNHEYETIVRNSIPYYFNRIKSRDVYEKMCEERLAPEHRVLAAKLIQERKDAFGMISNIITALKESKGGD